MRRILGLLALVKKYGAASADDSCAVAGKAVSAPTASSAATWNGICNCPWAGGK